MYEPEVGVRQRGESIRETAPVASKDSMRCRLLNVVFDTIVDDKEKYSKVSSGTTQCIR